jgi:hypothetical protein
MYPLLPPPPPTATADEFNRDLNLIGVLPTLANFREYNLQTCVGGGPYGQSVYSGHTWEVPLPALLVGPQPTLASLLSPVNKNKMF